MSREFWFPPPYSCELIYGTVRKQLISTLNKSYTFNQTSKKFKHFLVEHNLCHWYIISIQIFVFFPQWRPGKDIKMILKIPTVRVIFINGCKKVQHWNLTLIFHIILSCSIYIQTYSALYHVLTFLTNFQSSNIVCLLPYVCVKFTFFLNLFFSRLVFGFVERRTTFFLCVQWHSWEKGNWGKKTKFVFDYQFLWVTGTDGWIYNQYLYA